MRSIKAGSMRATGKRDFSARNRHRIVCVCCLCALVTAIDGCAAAERLAAQHADNRIALNQCVVLEPGLYRCPGIEPPLCTPDFARTEVECAKVSSDGVPDRAPAN